MRLIDADKLIAWIKESQQMTSKMRNIICKIESMPDAVEVVRCKDCKHRYDDGWLEPRWTCDYLKDMRLKDDDFCSYGEREGE